MSSVPRAAFSPAQVIAISKLVSDEEVKMARAQLTPGVEYDIDLKLHLVGDVKIKPNGLRKPTSSTPWLATLALVLQNSGCTRERSMQMVMEAIEASAGLDEAALKALYERTGVGDILAELGRRIDALPKVKVSGAIVSKVEPRQI